MVTAVFHAVTMAPKGSVTLENGLYVSYALFLVQVDYLGMEIAQLEDTHAG
jgi:hypothetical protein